MKPFPSKINWRKVWKHRWLFLNLINQIAYGSVRNARDVAAVYHGSMQFADSVYEAARECIEVNRD